MDFSDAEDLSAIVNLGRFLLDNYQSQDGHIVVDHLLSDLMDLCDRFNVNFTEALDSANDRHEGRISRLENPVPESPRVFADGIERRFHGLLGQCLHCGQHTSWEPCEFCGER